MPRRLALLVPIAALLTVLFAGPGGQAAHAAPLQASPILTQQACDANVAPGFARCFALQRVDDAAKHAQPARPGAAAPAASAAALGNNGAYDPAYLQSAYNLASLAARSSGATVAIVDAYDDPSAEQDLAGYRALYNLPVCSTANGCFRKIDQAGGTTYPVADVGWAQEISLDLDMVSAICPNCRILLVEASDNSFTNLAQAVQRAAGVSGVVAISNSYGGIEFGGETSFDAAYNHPGIAVTVSTGDAGYGVQYPAASPYVTAVGGTNLHQSTNSGSRSATETAWTGAGSGCSSTEAKPSWQHDNRCTLRTVADVAAVADPATGVWMYDSYGATCGATNLCIFGGTSVSTPIIAAVYALAGTTNPSATFASFPYRAPSAFVDITSGSNGNCGGTYLCTAVTGYDGPTGLGTPNGIGGFTGSTTPPPTPDFALAAGPTSQTVTAGNSTSFNVTATALNGYSAAVNLSASGQPAGVTVTPTPSAVTPTASGAAATLNVTTTAATLAGSYTLTLTGRGTDAGATTHTSMMTLVVNAAGPPTCSSATLTASPSGSTTPGTPVALSATAVCGGTAEYRFSVTPAGGSSTLLRDYLTSTSASWPTTGLAVGAYTLQVDVRVQGSGGAAQATNTLSYQLRLSSGPVTITSPVPGSKLSGTTVTFSWSVAAGIPTSFVLYVGHSLGAADISAQKVGATSTSVSGLPSDGSPVYLRLWYQQNGSWANLDASYTAVGGGGPPPPTPDFTLAAGPASQTVTAGNSTSFNVTATALNGYSAAVNLSASGQPAGVTLTPTPGAVTPTASGAAATLNVTTTAGTPAGSYTLTLTGRGTDAGTTTHTATVTLVVNAASVPLAGTLTFTTQPVGAPAGQPLATQPVVTLINNGTTVAGFTGPVTLSIKNGTGTLGGVTTVNAVAGVATFSGLSVSAAGAGYVLTAASSGLTSSDSAAFTVTAVPPPSGPITMTAPLPGSTLAGTTVTFSWTAAAGIPSYFVLYVGHSLGTADISAQKLGSGTASVSGLPSDGSPVYVRLWYQQNGSWQSADFTFTAV